MWSMCGVSTRVTEITSLRSSIVCRTIIRLGAERTLKLALIHPYVNVRVTPLKVYVCVCGLWGIVIWDRSQEVFTEKPI